MRNYILILGVALLFSACTNYTCEDFKTGEFVYSDTTFKDVKITRTLTGEQAFHIMEDGVSTSIMKPVGEQTEMSMRDGRQVSDVYSVIWDGPCSYSLVFKETSNQIDQFHTKYDTIRMRVLEINKDRFLVEANLLNERIEGELIKLK